jgi:hypothetical protein
LESIKPIKANKTTEITVTKILHGSHMGSQVVSGQNHASGTRGRINWAACAPIMPPRRISRPEKIICTIFPKPSVIFSPRFVKKGPFTLISKHPE